MLTFATDYFILVFIASTGVLQFAASVGRLNGLLLFKSPLIARALGLTLVVAAFVLFFSTGERNVNDFEGGLDAPTQALFFFLGAFAAMGVTFAVTSLVNMRMNGNDPSPTSGLDALKDMNYLRALYRSLAYWCREWRGQTKDYFFG